MHPISFTSDLQFGHRLFRPGKHCIWFWQQTGCNEQDYSNRVRKKEPGIPLLTFIQSSATELESRYDRVKIRLLEVFNYIDTEENAAGKRK